jgi:hypothetical protein
MKLFMHHDQDSSIETYFLPVSGFPASKGEVVAARQFLANLISSIQAEERLSVNVFVQVAALSLGEAAKDFAGHAMKWKPTIGMGVWPDRPAPTMYSREEFQNLKIGERPRRLMHQIFLLDAACSAEATDEMIGSGTVLLTLTHGTTEAFLKTAKDLLVPRISDTSFSFFPFYVPLLERKSVGHPAEILESWLCGVSVYVRESMEDNGILIVSRHSLAPLLKRFECRMEEGSQPAWIIPNGLAMA